MEDRMMIGFDELQCDLLGTPYHFADQAMTWRPEKLLAIYKAEWNPEQLRVFSLFLLSGESMRLSPVIFPGRDGVYYHRPGWYVVTKAEGEG